MDGSLKLPKLIVSELPVTVRKCILSVAPNSPIVALNGKLILP